jgi:hypothetical protein
MMVCRLVALSGVLGASSVVRAQAPAAAASSDIYSCTDDKGHRLTADRPIAECSSREQRVLNKDGSLKGIRAPTLTAEERAEREAQEAAAAELRAARADAVRRDRNLMARYPNEGSHNRAREAALDTARRAMKATEIRLRELAAERKPLQDELEFYQGKTVPHKLKTQIDANDAALDAQRSAVANQEAEILRITQLYDAELERLRQLWTGAQAGSLGPLPNAGPPAGASGPKSAGTGGRPPIR